MVHQQNVVQPLRFVGQVEDTETGFYYNYHRYYNPKIGRYTQPDPIGLAGGINPYVYADNNPIMKVDPSGFSPLDAIRINNVIKSTIRDMTKNGKRTSPWYNNAVRNLAGFPNGPVPYNSEKFGHYLQCYEQVDEINKVLESLKSDGLLDDNWTFRRMDKYYGIWGIKYGHSTGEAQSDNPSDPIIRYDPFNGK